MFSAVEQPIGFFGNEDEKGFSTLGFIIANRTCTKEKADLAVLIDFEKFALISEVRRAKGFLD
jgi:hypothetical protein